MTAVTAVTDNTLLQEGGPDLGGEVKPLALEARGGIVKCWDGCVGLELGLVVVVAE